MLYTVTLPVLFAGILCLSFLLVLLDQTAEVRMISFVVVAIAVPYMFQVEFGSTVIDLRQLLLYVNALAVVIALLQPERFPRPLLRGLSLAFMAALVFTFSVSTYLPFLIDVVMDSKVDIGSRLRFGILDSALLVVGFWGAYAFLSRRESARRLLKAVLIATALIVAEGLVGYIFGTWREIAGAQSGQPWRLGTVLGGGFDLTGRVIALGVVAALYFLLTKTTAKAAALFMIVVGPLVAVFTLTRGVYIAVGLGIVLSFVVLGVHGRRLLILVGGVLACGVAAVAFGPRISTLFAASRPEGLTSQADLGDRFNFWDSFFRPTFESHFPFGLGFGSAQQSVYDQALSASYFGPNPIEDITIHSFQLAFLLENGIGGAVILGMIVAAVIALSARILRGHGTTQAESGILWVMVVILFATLSIVTLPYLTLTLFTLFGVLLGLTRKGERSATERISTAIPERTRESLLST